MTHDELLKRLREATGADREIDEYIALFLDGWTREKRKGDAKPYWREPGKDWRRYDNQCLRYTASLDAAIALVERMLPGRSWQIREQKESSFPRAVGSQAMIMAMAERETIRGDFSARGQTPALALLIALLEALSAKREPKP